MVCVESPSIYLVSHPWCSHAPPVHPLMLLSSLSAATRCRAGERWRTPGWSARKTTSTSASCACVPSWTTRWENRPHPFSSNWAAPSPGSCSSRRLVSDVQGGVHACLFSADDFIVCVSLHVSLQYGFNMVMSHPHAVNEIALSLNNKNPRWGFFSVLRMKISFLKEQPPGLFLLSIFQRICRTLQVIRKNTHISRLYWFIDTNRYMLKQIPGMLS